MKQTNKHTGGYRESQKYKQNETYIHTYKLQTNANTQQQNLAGK